MRTHILVVDDDALQRELLTSLLQGDEFSVVCASDGREALCELRPGWFDVVLMDFQMPSVDGVGTIRLAREFMPGGAAPAFIAITSAPERLMARQRAEGVAFDAIVAKPWDPGALMALLRSCGGQGRRSRRIAAARLGAPADPPPASGPPRVLAVDDDELVRSLVAASLQRAGCDVHSTASGLDAAALLVRSEFDVVVLDHGMPELDGLTAARLIRDHAGTAAPRVIGYTSTPERLRDSAGRDLLEFDVVLSKSEGTAALCDHVLVATAHRRANRDAVYLARIAADLAEAAMPRQEA